MKSTLFCLLSLCVFSASRSQHFCGTAPEPFEKELERRSALQQIKSSPDYLLRVNDATIYVPIKMMLFGHDDGTSFADAKDVNDGLAELNRQFKPVNIEFYFSGSSFSYFPNSYFNSSQDDLGEFQDFHLENGATDAINVYLKTVLFVNGANYGGISPVTPDSHYYNRMLIQTWNFNDDYTTVHEFGHYFGLYHTFKEPGSISDKELVTRNFNEELPRLSANCEDTADYICDTHADPYGNPDASAFACIYTGTGEDLNGDFYTPEMTNFMSYYNCRALTFTPGQVQRMADGYLLISDPLNTYTLDAPETVQNAPANVVATVADYGFNLTWTDNSDSETGYIIERAISADGPFIPVAGVAHNTTMLANVEGLSGQVNYFRIKPSNSKSNYSPVSEGVAADFPCQNIDGNVCYSWYDDTYQALRIEDFTLAKNGTPLIGNYATGCSVFGLSNYYDDFSAPVSAGDVIDFNVKSKMGDAGGAYDIVVKLYVDWNQDNDFGGPGENVFSSPQDGTFYEVSGQFTVPETIADGQFRLRVGLSEIYNPIEPCWIAYGEMEDYKLTNGVLNVVENKQSNFTIYPNPVSHTLNINSQNLTFSEITITDISGKIVEKITDDNRVINTGKLASGIYIVRAFSDQGTHTAKFVKK